MGQQASSSDIDDLIPSLPVASTPSNSSSCSPSTKDAWCTLPATSKFDRARDSVLIKLANASGSADPNASPNGGRSRTAARTFGNSSTGFGCGISGREGPEVKVSDVGCSNASVTWSYNDDTARKIHLSVLLLSSVSGTEQVEEVAFFETDDAARSFQLPLGTLARAAGPYCVQVIAEHGTTDRPELSQPGVSQKFYTPSDVPGPVCLRPHGEMCETKFSVAWDLPDDGGAAIESFEVRLQDAGSAFPHAVGTEKDLPGQVTISQPTERVQHFNDLKPGRWYVVEVRAKNIAGLCGPVTSLKVCTAFGAPTAPTITKARLLPGWARSATAIFGHTNADVDVVRLEFYAHVGNGSHSTEAYIVFVDDEECETDKQGSQSNVLEFPAASVEWAADLDSARCDKSSHVPDKIPCTCHIAVEPNKTYTFSIEAVASSGQRSGRCAETAPVFVPARVPLPPLRPPEVSQAQSEAAVELRWASSLLGGGLPLEFFKIGVMAVDPDKLPGDVSGLCREVSIPLSTAAAESKALPRSGSMCPSGEEYFGARVDGLKAGARYCFVLAAANALGTGRWSPASCVTQMPAAAPLPPNNAVATVALDARQELTVNLQWQFPLPSSEWSLPVLYHILLIPAEVGAGASSSSFLRRNAVCETVSADGIVPGARMSWTKALTSPGKYTVQLVAENDSSLQSDPTVLQFEVQPEAFKCSISNVISPPCWPSEPILVLGPAAADIPRFVDVEGVWMQTLLLWSNDSNTSQTTNSQAARGVTRMSSGPFMGSADVWCHFRRPGSSQVFRILLAGEVSTCRLQVALPSNVPMSIRLAVHLNSDASAKTAISDQISAPLSLLLSDECEILKPTWEVWSRQAQEGQAARWCAMPEALQSSIEAAWLEGQPKSPPFHLPENAGPLFAGLYEITFGDERRSQSSVRKLGPGGWMAKARRVVLDSGGEDTARPQVSAEDQCVICMERRRTHAFMHADTGDGHLAVCGDCAETFRAEAAVPGGSRAVRTCPICRRAFNALHRIYQ